MSLRAAFPPSWSMMKKAPWLAPTSGVSSDMMRRDTDSRSFCPCIIRLNLARLVFSQSCCLLVSVVSRRLAIIWLMLRFSSSSSPLASTVMVRVRSPSVTAIATSLMARTWLVSELAMAFTFSVSAFQVPATLGTSACPPSFPSVPTSFATRVTSPANTERRSTMLLMTSLICRISPRTSTVILRVRSPSAIAVATADTSRSCTVRLPASWFTLSVRSFQVPATPGTLAWPPSTPSVPTSRATRVTSEAKEESWSTMVLMVFFSSSISPLTSTVILRLRSPRATAVVTSAMLRTCPVRLLPMKFTESVRSFHVPATPGTLAWPPSLPSVPTSRATRVTSEAKAESWSTMVLMVRFSSSSSPLTSTVIFCDRSPRATAVVTSAMLRTCPVRLLAMKFTLSVRSFHVPATPGTLACPPSTPSVPTSRATRVTSAANTESRSTMLLMVFFSSSISPLTSAVIFWLKSPLATAVVTSAMLRTWPVRLPAMKFTESVRSFHVPATPGTSACPPSTPSVPTSRATRVTSSAKTDSRSTMELMTSLIWRISPCASTVILRPRSPSAMAVATADTSRSCTVRFPASWFTLLVRSRHTPATPSTRACPPSFPSVPTSLATRVTSAAKAESWSTIVLMVFFSSSISPLTSAVIFWLRSPLATAVVTRAMLRTWPVRLPAMKFTESVRSFHVPATPGTSAWPPSTPSVPTSRATRVTSSAKTESRSTMELMTSLIWRISPCASTVILRPRSPSAIAVATADTSRSCTVRFPASWFTLLVRSRHTPATPSTRA